MKIDSRLRGNDDEYNNLKIKYCREIYDQFPFQERLEDYNIKKLIIL